MMGDEISQNNYLQHGRSQIFNRSTKGDKFIDLDF